MADAHPGGGPLKIGLLWHSAASDNLGVGALTVANIAIAEAAAARAGVPVAFVILGWRERRAAYVTGPNVSRLEMSMRDLVDPRRFLATVRGCDLVLDIGAGDSFADIYGAKRIRNMLLAKSLVHAAGRPLVLSPQTMGPFSRPWARRAALASIRRCEAVFTRDALSTAFLREAGYTGPVGEATDVALRLPYAAPVPRPPGGPVRVGINVSGLLMNGGYTGRNMFGLKADYPALMHALVRRFAALPGCEVHLVPHVISDGQPVEDDHRASVALAAEIPGVVVAPRFGHPSEAKSYIAGLDFFLGARMHACIAAFSSGVPVVPIAYSRKFAGLFGSLGYGETLDCQTLPAEEIEARALAAFERRDALRSSAAAALARGLEKLGPYEDCLVGLLADRRAAA
jgi:polysaccharide pyruvyl transferase WcaK-like protein